MSSKYNGNDPKQRLNDIAEHMRYMREFIGDMSREEFLNDKKTQYAIIRTLEVICEATYWFVKHENGEALRKAYPDLHFSEFGAAGNLFRHVYNAVDYELVWDDIIFGKDIADMESLLEAEVPSYQRFFSKEPLIVDPKTFQGKTTVKALCRFIGIEYISYDDDPKIVNLVRGGGHRTVAVPTQKHPSLIIDLDALPDGSQSARTLEALRVLALDLQCSPAGTSLAALDLLEHGPNGEFIRSTGKQPGDTGRS